MTKSLFTLSERKAVEALAKELGYSSLQAYLRWLVEWDAKKHGKTSPLEETKLEHPAESFRRAWGEVSGVKYLQRKNSGKQLTMTNRHLTTTYLRT